MANSGSVEFDKARTYRPRLLIQGAQGMGQQYLAGALLHKFERLHVQSFDLSVLYSNPDTVSPLCQYVDGSVANLHLVR